MEKAQCLMWMKRRQFLNSNFEVWKNLISYSWEEKAFAEDASRTLGGCMWPPRSYSCSFCKREFRSAQALGGHMNVHRRDRARLKQSLIPQKDVLHHQYQNHTQNPLKSFDSRYPSEVCNLDYDLDPNPGFSIVASTLTSSRVSALSLQSDHTFMSPHPYSIIEEKHKVSDSLGVRLLEISHSKPQEVKNPREEDSTSLTHDDFVQTDFFMGFNSFISRNPPTGCYGDISCKRPKTNAFSMIKPRSSDRHTHQPEVIEPQSSSMEDIDLELRLGRPPKVK
ncbi:hypothetical protein P3X46_025587 [Hevea brasiliensis]|uniref:C2H2-type domain-containing protein n=1 Tax=Hevea brasiliensis TaxID=3981 RepID=A0ABQ9L9K3_HEVBR|nr:zinc finger protein 10-like [Hevea brasiliensis]KAJ9160157.1 hypothetical protein P3X46_025587 [Hevea brasiliensis]